MLKYLKIKNDNDINKFVKLADEIWHEYFPFLLSAEQINYMLEKFQSLNAIKTQQETGYEYYFVSCEGKTIGYVVFVTEKDYLFLSKLYFLKSFRGKGFGRETLKYLEQIAKCNGLKNIRLTVNKYNESSIIAYKKWGFEVIESKVFDIGRGYVMDDYIMQKVL